MVQNERVVRITKKCEVEVIDMREYGKLSDGAAISKAEQTLIDAGEEYGWDYDHVERLERDRVIVHFVGIA